jgi:hypothetical protein
VDEPSPPIHLFLSSLFSARSSLYAEYNHLPLIYAATVLDVCWRILQAIFLPSKCTLPFAVRLSLPGVTSRCNQ